MTMSKIMYQPSDTTKLNGIRVINLRAVREFTREAGQRGQPKRETVGEVSISFKREAPPDTLLMSQALALVAGAANWENNPFEDVSVIPSDSESE